MLYYVCCLEQSEEFLKHGLNTKLKNSSLRSGWQPYKLTLTL